MLALCPETPAENPSASLPFAFRGWMARPRAARFAMAECARVACSAEISAAVSLLFQLLSESIAPAQLFRHLISL